MQSVPYQKYRKYLGKSRKCLICNNDPLGKKRIIWAKDKYFKAIKCQTCKLITVDPGLTPFGLKMYYQENMTRRVAQKKKMKDRTVQYDLDKQFLEKYIKKGKVLDVGCGGGIFLSKLNKNFKKYGIDLDKSSIKFAKKNFKYEFRAESLENDSFKKNSFDLIIFRGVIEHLYNPKKILNRARELLKTKGKLFFCATPNANSFCASLYREKWNLWHPIQHINLFTVETLHKICGIKKFDILGVDYPYLGTPYENFAEDYKKIELFIKKNNKVKSPAFWGNMLTLILEKK